MTIRNALIALSLGFVAVPAAAADATAFVRVGDLNLELASGRDQLEGRLTSAARRLCDAGHRGVVGIAIENRCIAETVRNARPEVERAVAQSASGGQLALLRLEGGR